MHTDTIAAVATGMASSGIGIVRMSGTDALQVIDQIYRPKHGDKKLSKAKSHTIHYGFIYDGPKAVDEVMVSILRAPMTYTREDTVEINCHGGFLVTKRVLETVVKYGARLAEPGEFTKRAFLHGRIDLSQAEAVMDLIQAKNDFALESSLDQLKGSLKDKITGLRAIIIHEIAFLESALDDPEHISLEGYRDRLLPIVEDLARQIQGLIDSYESGSLQKEGIQTAIIGKPNAGKSSLMNLFVGKERAIVTDIAGTTRDTLEEQICLSGIPFHIMDTAGIRNTEDMVEKIGVDRAKASMENADFVLYVVDSSISLDENDYKILGLLQGKKAMALLNKSDLTQNVSFEDIKLEMDRMGLDLPVVSISAKEGSGIEEFIAKVKEMFFHGELQFSQEEAVITNVRHKTSLQEALDSLGFVIKGIQDQLPEDFYSIDLMDAYERLGSVIGESVGEDLVDEIFSKFCMGK